VCVYVSVSKGSRRSGILETSYHGLLGPHHLGPAAFQTHFLSHISPATLSILLFLTQAKYTHMSGYLLFLLPGRLFSQMSLWLAILLHQVTFAFCANVSSSQMNEEKKKGMK
jgi:hypothetical protein